jgi:hypothetical protein
MSESERPSAEPVKTGAESSESRSAWVGGGSLGQPRLSASVMSDANEGSRNKRRPWVWALAWVGGFVVAIAVLILILR